MNKMSAHAAVFCLFLFFNCPSYGATVSEDQGVASHNFDDTKNLDLINNDIVKTNKSEVVEKNLEEVMDDTISTEENAVGRTFGRPFKKMISSLMPLVFQIGAASTWAVVAAVVGVKTLFVTLVILKLLLVAGAAKIGALFASKGHKPEESHHGWQQPHKEIHLHIHGGHGGGGIPQEEHLTPWSRAEAVPEKTYNMLINPYSYAMAAGPQTIRTPYGNYMKVE